MRFRNVLNIAEHEIYKENQYEWSYQSYCLSVFLSLMCFMQLKLSSRNTFTMWTVVTVNTQRQLLLCDIFFGKEYTGWHMLYMNNIKLPTHDNWKHLFRWSVSFKQESCVEWMLISVLITWSFVSAANVCDWGIFFKHWSVSVIVKIIEVIPLDAVGAKCKPSDLSAWCLRLACGLIQSTYSWLWKVSPNSKSLCCC